VVVGCNTESKEGDIILSGMNGENFILLIRQVSGNEETWRQTQPSSIEGTAVDERAILFYKLILAQLDKKFSRLLWKSKGADRITKLLFFNKAKTQNSPCNRP
jgi:hypothetical protein